MPGPQPPWHSVSGGFDVHGRLVQQPDAGDSWTFVQASPVEPGRPAAILFVEQPDVRVDNVDLDPAAGTKATTEFAHNVREQINSFEEAIKPEPVSPQSPGLYASPPLENETSTQVGIAEHHGPDFLPAQTAAGLEAIAIVAVATKVGIGAAHEAYNAVKNTFSHSQAQPESPKPPPQPPEPPQPPAPLHNGTPIPHGPSPSFGGF